ncbi:monooxygenase [Cercophora scortea]|uniref:Monooxygenase n=1 Tax=Cercophora scortea TaxID=314031 RepID=A0AAE0MGI6_9PEZI|nr:monooxygenase [Cercophora scortea]
MYLNPWVLEAGVAFRSAQLSIRNILLVLRYVVSIIHVLYFHPLAHYPGPKSWLLTRLPFARGLRHGTLIHRLRALHDTYGPVVRYGANELSFTDPQAWKDIYGFHGGPDRNFERDPRFYQAAPNGAPSILSAANDAHVSVRRLLAPAFSDSALKAQEHILHDYVALLMAKLHALAAASDPQPVNLANYFQFTTFDIAGDLMYGQSFGCLDREEYHVWLKVMTAFFKRLIIGASLVALAPWIRRWLPYLVPKKYQEQTRQRFAFTVERVGQQLAQGETPGRSDFMTHMVRTVGKTGFALQRPELDATFDVLASAGAETTATALTGTVEYLLRNPAALRRLQGEIRAGFKSPAAITVASTASLPYLAAVLNEGMRLCPPAPSMRPRVVPEGGAVVCGKWLPAGTSVGIPLWSTFRSAANFAQPDAFIPERWLEASQGGVELQPHEPRAFMPFSFGPRDCLGRALGWAEMRLILASLVWHFDMEDCSPPPGKTWEAQKVFVMWGLEPMMVQLRARHGVKS